MSNRNVSIIRGSIFTINFMIFNLTETLRTRNRAINQRTDSRISKESYNGNVNDGVTPIWGIYIPVYIYRRSFFSLFFGP